MPEVPKHLVQECRHFTYIRILKKKVQIKTFLSSPYSKISLTSKGNAGVWKCIPICNPKRNMELKLHSVVRSSMHPCPGNREAIGSAILYNTRFANSFSAPCIHLYFEKTISNKDIIINAIFKDVKVTQVCGTEQYPPWTKSPHTNIPLTIFPLKYGQI